MNWSSHEFIWLDWLVLIVGLLGVVAAVWYAIWKDKKAQQGEDSSAYLFGKGEPWYVIGMAIFAANIGSEHLVGLAGTGAKDGVGMAHWEMQGWMILILGWLFVPFYQLLINKMGKIITMPDFLKFQPMCLLRYLLLHSRVVSSSNSCLVYLSGMVLLVLLPSLLYSPYSVV